MGEYVLRVKAKPQVVDGITYYDAVFAYKPYGPMFGGAARNERMWAATCRAAYKGWMQRPVEGERFVLVNWHGDIYMLKFCTGSVYDHAFDKTPIGKLITPYHRPRQLVMFHPRTDPAMADAA